MRKIVFSLILAVIVSTAFQCKSNNKPILKVNKQETSMDIKIKSTAFEDGGLIPVKYSCDGENVSPPLFWSTTAAGIKSYALICDDPDAPAGTWVHWVIYNIPENAAALPEFVPAGKNLDNGSSQGLNDFGNTSYGGPCPPSGTHRYFFKIYAIDTILNLKGDVTKEILLNAIKGHIIAEGQLIGKYSRSK
jgi:hypothetical protein